MIVNIIINGNEYEVNDNETVLATCLKLGVFVPHLCYLKGFPPSGACGLCAVEFEEGHVALSCLTPVRDGMNVKTESRRLSDIRKVNIEGILTGHNIDCLNCFRNGSCDLQDVANQIYAQSRSVLIPDAYCKVSKLTKISGFVFDDSKCIKCQRCVKFLNRFCNQELKTVDSLDSIQHTNDLSFNVVEVCPTAALNYEKTSSPEFLMDRIDTFDISDVFTPRISIYKKRGKINKIRSTDRQTLIRNRTRLSLKSIPDRVHDETTYTQLIDELSELVTSQTHEKKVFVIGDEVDIASLFYIKALAERVPNVCICMNDGMLSSAPGFEVGLTRSELPPMDYAFFLGDIPDITKFHISSYSMRLKGTSSIDVDFCSWSQFPNILNPILFVSINEFSKNNFAERLQSIVDSYMHEYGRSLKVKIVPNTVSQMLINEVPFRVSIDNFLKNFNKHDIQFICLIGDFNRDLKFADVPVFSHSVFPPDSGIARHVPAKHYIEDSAYYLNVFNEVVKTRTVISNGLKSHREFLFDLMSRVFGDAFHDINYDVHAAIKDRFFR